MVAAGRTAARRTAGRSRGAVQHEHCSSSSDEVACLQISSGEKSEFIGRLDGRACRADGGEADGGSHGSGADGGEADGGAADGAADAPEVEKT